MQLRDYQTKLVQGISDAFRCGHKGVIMQMATGAGKTATAGYIVKKYSETKRTVLWLVHRQELFLQASMTFSKLGIQHQLICAKNTERKCKAEQFRDFGRVFLSNDSKVYIASVQTMVRRLDSLAHLSPHLIVADECHLSLNNTFRSIIGRYPDARLLGLTATPVREDKQQFARSQGGLYDEMVCGPQSYELINAGMLADYDLFVPPVRMSIGKNLRLKKGDYDPKGLEEEFDGSPDVFGDVVEHYRNLSAGKPAIGFFPTVRIAEEFTERFISAGFKAMTLDGTTDDTERWRALKNLAEGKIDVIMSVDILIEGTDVPLATTVICLRKTKSLRIYLQSIGRVWRLHPKKEKAIILDFVGLTQVHGLPDDHREWSLTGEVKRRAKPREIDDDEVTRIQTCPQCFKAHEPAPACPKCGHEYTAKEKNKIKVVEGDLVKIERQAKIEKDKADAQLRQVKRLEESSCKTLSDWVQLAKSRNYKFPVQWATRRYELRVKRGAKF